MTWTDERLEERFDQIDRRFDEVDRRFDRVEGDIRELKVEMRAGFARIDAKFDAKFDSLHRTLLQLGGGGIAALLGIVATQL